MNSIIVKHPINSIIVGLFTQIILTLTSWILLVEKFSMAYSIISIVILTTYYCVCKVAYDNI